MNISEDRALATPRTTIRNGISRRARILIIDDHPMTQSGMAATINDDQRLVVCGRVSDTQAAIDAVDSLNPSLAIVELAFCQDSGLELIRTFHQLRPSLRILVFSIQPEASFAELALRAGAQGFLHKSAGAEKLLEAIHAVLDGETYFSKEVTGALVSRLKGRSNIDLSNPARLLSVRELEVLQFLGHGMPSREIARRLEVSVRTVDSHREHIKQKLDLRTAAQLVHYAFHWIHSRSHNQVGQPASSTQAFSKCNSVSLCTDLCSESR
ncbi:MAG: response regulator [Verrucomicrobiia bacterium]